MADEDVVVAEEEQEFHNNVREQIIFMLFFVLLYLFSFVLLNRFKRKQHRPVSHEEDYFIIPEDEDEVQVYRISTWLCTFSLAISLGAVLLLPMSIVSNEVLILYPDNRYYIKWLNSSLIQGLWNYIFLFSNLSLFVLLPFAYLFTESEGFFGHRKGLGARVYETVTVLGLLALVVLGMTYVVSALIDRENAGFQTLMNLWSYYLPFLYSCISFLGVLMLLVCTPLGFVRLFDVVSRFLIKPQFLRDINEEFYACALEEECLRRKYHQQQQFQLRLMAFGSKMNKTNDNRLLSGMYDSPMVADTFVTGENRNRGGSSGTVRVRSAQVNGGISSSQSTGVDGAATMTVQNDAEPCENDGLETRLIELETKRKLLDKQRRTSFFRRNVLHPVAMIVLVTLSITSILLVVQNTLSLLIGIRALPSSSQQFTLGVSSLSKLGVCGAALEIIIIVYLIVTSGVGVYSAPLVWRARPKMKNTPFSLVIGNCAMIVVLSSALPLLSKTLGITNFDLLGDFGSIEWLGNFKIVLLYNILFATVSTLCVVNKFTAKVRRELYARLVENYMFLSNCLVTYLN